MILMASDGKSMIIRYSEIYFWVVLAKEHGVKFERTKDVPESRALHQYSRLNVYRHGMFCVIINRYTKSFELPYGSVHKA